MAKTKWIYIIGSIIIGFVSIIGVFFGLVATGVISTTREKIVIATSSAEKVYDGTDLTCQEWSIVEGALKEGHEATVTATASIKEAGECANVFTVTITDHVGADVTEDYDIEKQTGTLTVTPLPIVVTTASAEKVYDGTALTHDAWELSSQTPLLEGHSI